MSEQPPTDNPIRDDTEAAPSIVIVNTGDGKGKSTAGFGTLLRALARGWDVAVIQFIKSGDWRVGEEQLLTELGADWRSIGDGFSWDAEDLDVSRGLAVQAWDAARDALSSGDNDVVMLDEITYPMNWEWIDTDAVVEAIRARAERTTVICTGRDAPAELVELANTVTEMRNVKHAYEQGIKARRGIDF